MSHDLSKSKMALNTAHAQGGVLIFSGERILIYYDGVEMQFDMDGNMPHFKGSKKGRIYLTTHRVIFNNKEDKDTLQSFSVPFYLMREVELEQPVFGANYIKGKVRAEMGGNWEGTGKFKLWFKTGGAIEFGQCLLEAGKRATRHAPAQPPPYTPPSGPYYQAPPPAYAPPQGAQYGFIPYATFPNAPPANGVFMTDAPPPYPGIDPAYPPGAGPPPGQGYPPGQPGYPPGQQGYPPGQQGYPPGQQGYPPGQQGYPPAGANPPPQMGGYPPQAGPYGPPPGGYPPPGAYPPPGGYAPPEGYPQMGPPGGYAPQMNGHMNEADPKAAEAAASAYYNPANPHNVYMPQQGAPPFSSAPPPYEHQKKDN